MAQRKASPSTYDQGFKRRLRLCREASGHTQTTIAKELGIKQNTYAKYENRSNSMLPHRLLGKFCDATECDPWYLLEGKGRKPDISPDDSSGSGAAA